MSITSISRDTNNNVSLVRMISTDTKATVASTNYILNQQDNINDLNGGVWEWFITDMIMCSCSDTNAFFFFKDITFSTLMLYGEQGSGMINPGLIDQIAYYSSNGSDISGLTSANSSVFVTSAGGVPSWGSVLPSVVQGNITALGTIASGVWQGTPVTVPYGGTGDSSFTAYSPICGGTTSGGALQDAGSLGTAGYLFTSNGPGALPTFQNGIASGTINTGGINDLAYYSTNPTGKTLSAITTGNNGVLITSGMGVPSISSTLPSAVQGNITALGTIATGVWNGTNIALGYGGTNASLTASNGGIVYSTASALAILSGTATAGQLLTSGSSTTPAWTTSTYPLTNAINTLLYASSANTMAALATANDGVLITSNTGVPSWLANSGTPGYVLTANSGAPPSWQNITAEGAITTIDGDTGSVTATSGTVTISGGSTGLTTSGSSHTLSLTGTLALANGGTNANLTASNGGIFYSTASAGAILSGTATANQILLSGSSTTPAWSTATYPASTTINQLLYSSSNNVIAGLATATTAVLTTSSGVPTWASELSLALGGTNANLTAAAGGIAYSTSTALALTSAGTSGQLLQSAGTSAPGWTTATYPTTAGTQYNVLQSTGTNITSATLTSVIDGAIGSTQGDVLYRSATAWTVLAPGTSGYFLQTQGASANPQWAAGGAGTVSAGTQYDLGYYATTSSTISPLATANSGVLVTSSGGVPSISSTLPAGLTIPTPLISGPVSGSFAASGNIGQIISSVILSNGSVVTLSSNTPANITNISVTAGNWLLMGNFGANFAANVSNMIGWISSTSATMPDGVYTSAVGSAAVAPINLTVPMIPISITTTTTYYLSVQSGFVSTAPTAFGAIYAIRLPG